MHHLGTPIFRDHHVVVFGGSSGIGLATALAAKHCGAKVTIIGRTLEKLEAAAEKIGDAHYFTADMAVRNSIEAVFEKISKVDHLVITAGSVHAGKIAESDAEQLLIEINEHITGSIFAVKAALALMPPTGSIVLTGGQFSDRPSGNGTSVMALACRGIEAFARELALEIKPIRVNVIAPGYVETPLYDAFTPETRAALLATAAEQLPVGRIGHPDEIADAILFLLRNGYMNCEVLHVDGGGRFA